LNEALWQLIGVVVGGLLIQLGVFAVAWGDMRRSVANNREREDERHSDNTSLMRGLETEVRKTNGMVIRHTAIIEQHTEEIKHLRKYGKDT